MRGAIAMPARASLLALAALLAGCAGLPGAGAGPGAGPEAQCRSVFSIVDAAVAAAGVRDAEDAPLAGFPYLRASRLLASWRDVVLAPEADAFWLDRLGALDSRARGFELANLEPSARLALRESLALLGWPEPPQASLDRCRQVLLAAERGDPRRRAGLAAAARVPDDYSSMLRVLGGYWLTAYPFAAGIRRWQAETERTFAQPLAALPVRGALARFAPAEAAPVPRAEVAQLIAEASINPLGVPLPDTASLRRLADAFAPVLEIDVASDDDLIGAIELAVDGRPRVAVARPAIYVNAAHTRVGDRVLLQIVYTAWFPARPAGGAFDLLSGYLDGLVWRVTLAPDGEPLVFDTIHPCGCYHMFFPTPRAEPVAPRPGIEEFLFVPQMLPAIGEDARVVLRIESRTHYLERVSIERAAEAARGTTRYALSPADDLRSLALPGTDGARRSLFGPQGLVAGTERAERWLFWPMGIAAPGSMRQWGRHATAFVGRRHFDDASLIADRFRLPGIDAPRTIPRVP